MLRDDFAVFILTHGRADNVVTADTLKRQKYSGKVYFIIDNEDDTAELYREKFGAENVIMFDKAAAVAKADTMDNICEHRAILYGERAGRKDDGGGEGAGSERQSGGAQFQVGAAGPSGRFLHCIVGANRSE